MGQTHGKAQVNCGLSAGVAIGAWYSHLERHCFEVDRRRFGYKLTLPHEEPKHLTKHATGWLIVGCSHVGGVGVITIKATVKVTARKSQCVTTSGVNSSRRYCCGKRRTCQQGHTHSVEEKETVAAGLTMELHAAM